MAHAELELYQEHSLNSVGPPSYNHVALLDVSRSILRGSRCLQIARQSCRVLSVVAMMEVFTL